MHEINMKSNFTDRTGHKYCSQHFYQLLGSNTAVVFFAFCTSIDAFQQQQQQQQQQPQQQQQQQQQQQKTPSCFLIC
jgi:hypothetical protein